MAKYDNFRSQSLINSINEGKQKARELVLKKAKEKYHVEEAKREKARNAGEGTWMLDSLSKRLANEEKVIGKEKKKKKGKKKKKKVKARSSSAPSLSSEEEAQWIEKDISEAEKGNQYQKGPLLQRESWMEAPLDLIPLTSRQEIREKINQEKAEARREATKMLQPGQHERELNPYWKEGGTGLPENISASKRGDTPTNPGSGDMGLSWLKTSLERCKQQAKDQQRSLEEVASERWGSLQLLMSKLKEAERQQKNRKRGLGDWDRYHQDSDIKKQRRKREIRDGRRDRRRGSTSSSEDKQDRSPKQRRRRVSTSDDDNSADLSSRKNKGRKREDLRSSHRQRSGEKFETGHEEKSRKKSAFLRPDSDDDRYMFNKSGEKSWRNENRPISLQGPLEEDEKSKHGVERMALKGRFARPESDDDVPNLQHRKHQRDEPRWKKKPLQMESKEEASRNKEQVRKEKRKKKRTPSPSSSDDDSSSNLSEPDKDKREPSQPVKILSEEELNDLAAKILRAEIMGEEEMAAELKEKLEKARAQREEAKSGNNFQTDFAARQKELGAGRENTNIKGESAEDNDTVVVLSRTNKAGMVRPVLGGGATSDPWGRPAGGKKRKKNVTTHDKTGTRTTYFDNDDRYDLKTLVEQEKTGTAEDQNSMFARLAGRSVDKDLDVDDMFVSRAAIQQNEEKIFEKDKAGAIFEHQKRSAAMGKCNRCLKQVPKHLIIALGTKSYVCLPGHRSLTEGHCLIVPMSHSPSATTLDEDVWQEMQRFRQSLVRMFMEQEQDVVIMETVMHLKHFPHTVLECVPLDRELGDLAPIYFKKAIQDAGPEWSDNKKLHDLKGKDVRRVIPKGFPYFAVDFGLQSGYATVIEEEARFPAYFGREIVGGMLDAEPMLWRKPHKQSFEDQRQKVLQFEKWWKPFDWTHDLTS